MFIDRLTTAICSPKCMFWVRELEAGLTELARYADTLPGQQHREIQEN